MSKKHTRKKENLYLTVIATNLQLGTHTSN